MITINTVIVVAIIIVVVIKFSHRANKLYIISTVVQTIIKELRIYKIKQFVSINYWIIKVDFNKIFINIKCSSLVESLNEI